jgi:serine/threonine-protein kinase
MLYELATGEPPFTGDTSVSVLSSIIKDTPRAVTDLQPALPRELGRIIRQCLVKVFPGALQRGCELRVSRN